MKTFMLRHRVLLLLCGLTLFGLSADAQTYKRVKALSEVRDGMRCTWIGRSRLAPDQYAVMQRQETSGTGTKNRKVVVVEAPLTECITALPEDAAVFVAESQGDGWAFRDVANDGYLAYPTTKASSSNIPVYTLDEGTLASSSTYNALFQFDFSNAKSCVSTQERVLTTGTSGTKANFLLKYDRLSAGIRLYETLDTADSLFLYYRDFEPLTVAVNDAGDRTFYGDWMPDDLVGLDLSQARSVDFTKVDLFPEWPQADGGQTLLPPDYAWTYVRQGDGGNLPEGWPNVIEIGANSRAVTPLRGDDRNECGPKYTFSTTESCGIDWYREADGGGWATIGLPFAPSSVTWDGPDGEAATLERRVYKECADGGAVFAALADGNAWTARTAYLWRTDGRSGTLCFHAGVTTIYAAAPVPETDPGFHAALCRYDLDGEGAVYLLDATGTVFVRAAAGSHIAPTRGYLQLPGVEVKGLHITEAPDVTSVAPVSVPSSGIVPVYTAGGMLKGWLPDGASLPSGWPRGLYLTPKGKIWKP